MSNAEAEWFREQAAGMRRGAAMTSYPPAAATMRKSARGFEARAAELSEEGQEASR